MVSGMWSLGLMFAIVMGYAAWQRRNPKHRHLLDRADPPKYWVQAAMAIYQGDVGDPGYWSQRKARGLLEDGWSTEDAEGLVELIHRYIGGECNVAFDKLRIIWLARLGHGAGWIDEATSWGYAFGAKADLQRTYASWDELLEASYIGRDEWYGGSDKVPESSRAFFDANYREAARVFLPHVPFHEVH